MASNLHDVAAAQAAEEDHHIRMEEAEAERKKGLRKVLGEKAGNALTGLDDRVDYLDWLIKHMTQAEVLNRSASRITICLALAGMPNFEVNDERDEMKGLPVGTDMLEAIMPPPTDKTWGTYGRPKRLHHQIVRMEGKDSRGKPVDLIKVLYGPEGQLDVGRVVAGYKLDATGICYAYLYGNGRVTKDDLFDYWMHITQGHEFLTATNPAYLALTGEGPEVDESPDRWSTPGAYAWASLNRIEREDPTIPERYKDRSAQTLSRVLKHVYMKEAARCLEFLDDQDRMALYEDVMERSGVGDSKYARAKVFTDIDGAKDDKERIKVLAAIYGDDDAVSDAKVVIEEFVCRCAWAVVTRVMDYRTGKEPAGAVDAAKELMKHAVTLEQLEALQQLVGDLAVRIGATPTGFDGEWEKDGEPF